MQQFKVLCENISTFDELRITKHLQIPPIVSAAFNYFNSLQNYSHASTGLFQFPTTRTHTPFFSPK